MEYTSHHEWYKGYVDKVECRLPILDHWKMDEVIEIKHSWLFMRWEIKGRGFCYFSL